MDKVHIIAEVANSHEGSVPLAKCFIKAVADCGADAVKFQTHIFAAESLKDAPNPAYFKSETRESYFNRTAFSAEEWLELREYAERECRIDFISSPFSLEAVDLLEGIGLKTYKIPSGEVTNIPLLRKIAGTGKRVILSSGMSSWRELDAAVETLRQYGCSELTVLQCTSEYPCPPEEVGLNIMREIAVRYGVTVGLSDHTLGVAAPLVAVASGATIIEKHFILSNQMYGSDAKHSMEPREFARLVSLIREAEAVLSGRVNKDEKAASLVTMKQTFEKIIVAAKALHAGETITEDALTYKKTSTPGIFVNQFSSLLGRKVKKDISPDYVFHYEDLEGE